MTEFQYDTKRKDEAFLDFLKKGLPVLVLGNILIYTYFSSQNSQILGIILFGFNIFCIIAAFIMHYTIEKSWSQGKMQIIENEAIRFLINDKESAYIPTAEITEIVLRGKKMTIVGKDNFNYLNFDMYYENKAELLKLLNAIKPIKPKRSSFFLPLLIWFSRILGGLSLMIVFILSNLYDLSTSTKMLLVGIVTFFHFVAYEVYKRNKIMTPNKNLYFAYIVILFNLLNYLFVIKR